jgi:transcriptional regulator with XRE-family HTH domain
MNHLRNKSVLLAFGRHLSKMRKEKGFTLESLAFEAEMEISQIYRIEKGHINPTLSTLHALAKALNINLMDLMNFKSVS